MAGPSVVQEKPFTTIAAAASGTLAVAATAAGNLLQVVISCRGSTVSSVTDSAGNTWAKQLAQNSASPFFDLEVWMSTAASPASITSVTVTVAASSTIAFQFFEISGADNTAPVNTSHPGTGSGVAMSSGASGVPTSSSCLAFGAFANSGSASAIALTAGAPTTYGPDSSSVSGAAGDVYSGSLGLAAAAAQTATATRGSTGQWSALIWLISPASGGGGGTPRHHRGSTVLI